MEFRKPYTQLSLKKFFEDVSLTKQSSKDDCDINNILAKYQRTGLLEFVNERQPQYADFSGFDFHGSMQVVAKANEMFSDLPATVRKRFNNEPSEFLAFVDDPNNFDEAVKLGLAYPRSEGGAAASAAPASEGGAGGAKAPAAG